jgi:hypothetical protein
VRLCGVLSVRVGECMSGRESACVSECVCECDCVFGCPAGVVGKEAIFPHQLLDSVLFYPLLILV